MKKHKQISFPTEYLRGDFLGTTTRGGMLSEALRRHLHARSFPKSSHIISSYRIVVLHRALEHSLKNPTEE